MLLARYRNIIVALLMMTFIGQAVASASMSCPNQAAQSQSQEQMMDSAGMDHSQHTGMNSADGLDSSECCPDCDCSIGGCMTPALAVSQHTFASNLTTLASSNTRPPENQLTVPLYRPPISR
jgi:hypothetical protein